MERYDGVGRLAEARHPGYDGPSHRTQYHHDSVGNVYQIISGRGHVIEQTFDDANRLLTRS